MATAGSNAAVIVRRSFATLGDVADASRLPAAIRDKAATLVVADVPARGELTVSRSAMLARLRAQMPLLRGQDLNLPETVSLLRGSAVVTFSRTKQGCLRARRDVTVDTILRADDFEPWSCGEGRLVQSFRYDVARRAVVANDRLAAGTVIGRFRSYGAKGIQAGEKLSLISRAGPVTVTREVDALQSAVDTQRLFVRTAEGETLSLRYGARP